ncbi:MAG TPA: FtsW/RodA/SpoVE family cell cycle protein, partial [Solirubrobacteraceae bacterium]
MPAAPARAGSSGAPRSDGKRARRKAPALGAQPLEQRILLTATLCLLAFGAVMVYSASSPRSLLEGQGNGGGALIKFVIYGAVGLVAMRLAARDGLRYAKALTAPLLVISFVLVAAVHIPHLGVEVNGAKRW